MREIKLRAWDNNLNIMRQIKYLSFSEHGAMSITVEPLEKPWICKECGTRHEATISIDNSFYGGSFELMQYTGLKDKNGKEIYEGDIVEYKERGIKPLKSIPKGAIVSQASIYGSPDKAHRRVVEFDAPAYHLFLDEAWPYKGARAWEVIGNIYENPELLEGGKE